MVSGYDTYKRTLNSISRPERPSRPSRYGDTDLSPTQQEVQAYARDIKANEKPKTKPLEWIFDRLQTGQYVTANMVDQALANTKKDDPLMEEIGSVLKAGWQGITGEKKGNYKDILTEYTDMEDRKGKVDAVDLLGFVGDVLLDPLTYVTFGASKMGVQAASKYADDVAKLSIRTLGKKIGEGSANDILKYTGKNFSKEVYDRLYKESADKAIKYFQKNAGGGVAREVANLKKLAYKEALQTPANELREKIATQVRGLIPETAEKVDDIGELILKASKSGDTAVDLGKAIAPEEPSYLQDFLEKVPTLYEGAGSRQVGNFFGIPIGESVRPLNSWERMKTALGTKISETGPAKGLKDVWWRFNNTGVMGDIRQKLGIRDPYQKLVNLNYMEEGKHYHMAQLREYSQKAQQATAGFEDKAKQDWIKLNDVAEELYKEDNSVNAFKLLEDPIMRERLGIKEEEVEDLIKLGTNVEGLIRTYRANYMKAANEGVVTEMGDIMNYLPLQFKNSEIKTSKYFTELGSSAPGYSKHRAFTRAENIDQQAAKWEHYFNISKSDAIKAIRENNLGDINMDLDELLALRGYAQAQVDKRANIIRTFKEFGIPIKDLAGSNDEVLRSLTRSGGQLSEFGLATSKEMGLEGLAFDKEVLGVFNRVAQGTDPKHITAIQKKFVDFNSWWKGMATMTTGFHARNAISNNVTGWMVHGFNWFDPKKTVDANAMAVYAMKKGDVTKALSELNMSEGMYKRLLNTRYGDYSLKELADMQIKSGLLSEAQMGIDAKNAFEKYMKHGTLNPFSNDFKGRDVSQKLGGWIENSAKAKSFLIDYTDILKQGGEVGVEKATSDSALKYAERNAKKWWLDYSDLTEFEQKTMKNIVPFYSWMRKNIGNQIEGILIYPQNFSIFPKAMDAMTYDDPDFDPADIPEWMRDLGMFPTRGLPGMGTDRALFRPDMPFMDLNKIPITFEGMKPQIDFGNLKDDLVNAVRPEIKTLASLATDKGYDFFRKQDLAEDAPAPLFLRFLTKNVDTLQKIDGIFNLAGITGFQPKVDQNGKLRMNAKWLQFFENNMPIIRNLNILTEGISALPGVEEAIQEATGYTDDYEKADQLFRVLGSLTGVKFYPMDTEKLTQDANETLWRKAEDKRIADKRFDADRIEAREKASAKRSGMIRRATQ